jgi:hypothetical protein
MLDGLGHASHANTRPHCYTVGYSACDTDTLYIQHTLVTSVNPLGNNVALENKCDSDWE